MKTKIKSKIIVPHIKGCKSDWSGVIGGNYMGNYAANPDVQHGRYHLWYKVLCNNTSCPGIKAVHSSVLIDA